MDQYWLSLSFIVNTVPFSESDQVSAKSGTKVPYISYLNKPLNISLDIVLSFWVSAFPGIKFSGCPITPSVYLVKGAAASIRETT